MLEICKWKHDADAPVLLMVDDLANVWVDSNRDGRVDPGEDWGYARDEPHSSFRYLTERVLRDFPAVKVTFFTPVGIRASLVADSPLPRIARPIDADAASSAFFRMIHQSPRFELAYHGTTHGRSGGDARHFQQEWLTYPDLAAAEAAIARGKQIFRAVCGSDPAGGKYCGYRSNRFSDASIDHSGFLWWCRYWNRGAVSERNCAGGGPDRDPLTAFDIKYFGNRPVIDIPSTLSGGLFTYREPAAGSWRSRLKSAWWDLFVWRGFRQIDALLRHRLVISIQEHIAPAREDGRRQQPNIFDDTAGLRLIFGYLRRKNVWYCTGTELAEYVWLRDRVTATRTGPGAFRLVCDAQRSLNRSELTIRLDRTAGSRFVRTPAGELVPLRQGLADIPFQDGEYRVV